MQAPGRWTQKKPAQGGLRRMYEASSYSECKLDAYADYSRGLFGSPECLGPHQGFR